MQLTNKKAPACWGFFRSFAEYLINTQPMADTGTIEEHSLYPSFIQLEPNLWLNCHISGNTSRTILPIATSLLGRIYGASKILPVVGAMFGARNGSENFEVLGFGHTVFIDDNVLVTVGIKVM